MTNFRTQTTDVYGYLNMEAATHCQFINVHSLRDAAVRWLKKVLKMPENAPIFKEDGTLDTKTTLQNWINDYGVLCIDNMEDKPETAIICVDDAISHIICSFGFLTVNRITIKNSLFNEVLNSVANDWKMQDFEYKAVTA